MIGKKALVCLLVATLAGGGLAISASPFVKKDEGPDLHDLLSAPKTVSTLRLYGANKDAKTGKSVTGKSVGTDYNSPDGRHKIRSHYIYESGASEDVFYRKDESKEWSRDYYPLRSGETLAVLRAIAHFAADGETYVSHDVWRIDGKFERRGKLLADGDYEQVYYCADGKTVQTRQLFDKSKRFKSETAIFCSSGKPIREVAKGEYGSRFLTLFREDGSVSVKMKMEDGGEVGAIFKGEVFDKSGKKTIDFDKTGFGHNIRSTRNGQLIEWSENMYYSHTLEMTVHAPGKPELKLYTQHWEYREAYKPKSGLVLVKVVEFGADKKETRQIEFDKKSGKPVKVSIPAGSGKLVYTLDKNGMIVKAEREENGKKADAALPASKSLALEAEKTALREAPAIPEWDDGETATREKVYDFH